jgi:hypothetical protein
MLVLSSFNILLTFVKKIELNGKFQKFKVNFRREIYLNEVEDKNHRRYHICKP